LPLSSYPRQSGMKTILLTLSVVALFSACTTGEKMSSLEPGMTRQQVVGILGRPDAVRSSGPYEQLEYTHRLITGWSWDRSDFNVILKDARVVEFGHVDIYAQPNPAQTPTLHTGSAVAENGSYYGEPNKVGIPKTVPVRGYFRKDGTYVPGHFRSRPTGRTKKLTW
jgi:SmpA / OmlA family